MENQPFNPEAQQAIAMRDQTWQMFSESAEQIERIAFLGPQTQSDMAMMMAVMNLVAAELHMRKDGLVV